MPSSLLNGQAGAEWLAAASLLTVSETFLMPEGFVPCIVLLDYGTEADAMVVFTQTGQGDRDRAGGLCECGNRGGRHGRGAAFVYGS